MTSENARDAGSVGDMRDGQGAAGGTRIPAPPTYGGAERGGPEHVQGHAAPAPPPGHQVPPRPRLFCHVPSGITGPHARMTPEHRYRTPEGATYASVTTVLGATKPEEDALRLEEWRRRTGYEVADHIMRESAIIGTQAHHLNECYLQNAVPGESDGPFRLLARAHHENFRPHLDRIDEIRGTELVLHSDNLRLAGTSDCIAEYDGVLSIIDYKTKRASQREEWMRDYFLQAAAYSMMYEEMSGVAVRQAVVMASSEAGTMQVFFARICDHTDEFLERLNMYFGAVQTDVGSGGAHELP